MLIKESGIKNDSGLGGSLPLRGDIMTDKYADRLLEIIENDSETVHFYQNVADDYYCVLSGDLFPKGTSDPLEYMLQNGLIEKNYESVFNVFCSKIVEGAAHGISSNSLYTELSVKLNGEFKLCRMYAFFLRDSDGKITDIHYNIRPFSGKETYEREILKFFTSDKNPKLFSRRCADLINKNPDKNIAFIQFDVERFKLINEIYGVEMGDELLNFFGDTLGIICDENQPFARLTADVFMIVTTFDERDDLVTFIRKAESMLSDYKGMEYRLIFGVASVDDRTCHTRRHGDNASIARQNIKGNALENIGFYESDMKSKLQKQQSIEEDMQKALIGGEFLMFLQPKHSIKSGKIIGAEALARWNHPVKGMISPAEFVPVFEKNGFILKLDSYIWEEACRKIREWIDCGIAPVPISVNISREYVRTFDVVGKITSLIKKYDVPIKLLELEITESADSVGVEDVVKKMKDAGFTMLMDDFGTGYSSMNMLKNTPFDVLKLDKSFLDEFMESDRGRKIIEHTISMSQDIGLDIVAEGVETIEQAQFLSRCGCDSAQGFYYSKPIPAAEFDRRLKENNL